MLSNDPTGNALHGGDPNNGGRCANLDPAIRALGDRANAHYGALFVMAFITVVPPDPGAR
jgi:hypothetical protein